MLLRTAALMSLVLAVATTGASTAPAANADGSFTLTILHNNDASSRLLNPGEGLEDYGGVSRFKAVVDRERSHAASGPNAATVVLSAGNSIEAGPNLEASLAQGAPFYDAVALMSIGYDAVGLGDQDFGLGPDVLADLLCATVRTGGGPAYDGCGVSGRSAFPFLAANLGFEHEPRLQAFVDNGGLAASTIVRKGEHRIGIIGVTTPALDVVATPRNVSVMSNTAFVVQTQIDLLEAEGVDKIIVLSQLRRIDEDIALTAALTGVDVVVAGGTGEMLSKPDGLFVPGDRYEPGRAYPLYATSKDGVQVPIVTVGGGYAYLGKLVVEFDDAGEIVWVDPGSGPIRVAGPDQADGVPADPILKTAIDRPLQAFIDGLASSVVATSDATLDGRTDAIRSGETNLGDLMADAALWQARQLAGEFGVAEADVAILNAGGMRLDSLRAPGPLSRLETYEIAPFSSFISVVEDVTPAELKLVMENALSQLLSQAPRFGQIAGMTVIYDPAGEALAFDSSGTPQNTGARVLSIQLDDGTYIVRDGAVVSGARDVTVATIDFMARGGDQYPFSGGFTVLGVTYQQALEAYVTEALGGVIAASQYPAGGNGRISAQ